MNDHTVSQAIEALLVARDLRNMAVARAALPTGYYLRAARLLRDIRGTVIIGTGFPVNDTFETDGPVGAIALYDSLQALGAQPVIACGPPLSGALADDYRVLALTARDLKAATAEAVQDGHHRAEHDGEHAEVEHQKPVKDEKRVAGAALGAVIGGVLGNQVGDGDGQKLATAAGAVAGGIAGSKLQKRVQQSNTEMVTERQCETVYDSKEKTVGYDVRYRIGSSEQTVRMRTDPGVGAQLPLRNGKLIS